MKIRGIQAGVTVWDGNALKLVSWNNADANYGNTEWTLK